MDIKLHRLHNREVQIQFFINNGEKKGRITVLDRFCTIKCHLHYMPNHT